MPTYHLREIAITEENGMSTPPPSEKSMALPAKTFTLEARSTQSRKLCPPGFEDLTPGSPDPLCYRAMEPETWAKAQDKCFSYYSHALELVGWLTNPQALEIFVSVVCNTIDMSSGMLYIFHNSQIAI